MPAAVGRGRRCCFLDRRPVSEGSTHTDLELRTQFFGGIEKNKLVWIELSGWWLRFSVFCFGQQQNPFLSPLNTQKFGEKI